MGIQVDDELIISENCISNFKMNKSKLNPNDKVIFNIDLSIECVSIVPACNRHWFIRVLEYRLENINFLRIVFLNSIAVVQSVIKIIFHCLWKNLQLFLIAGHVFG